MPAYADNPADRKLLNEAMAELERAGLNRGTSGNISLRTASGMLISPTGIAARDLCTEHPVHMSLSGEVYPDQLTPSSEWRMHAGLYRRKEDVNAIVHCHSPYATTLACAHKPIPALHYLMGLGGGHEIPLARYETFGTQALSRACADTLSGARACLLANHGQLAVGADLATAMALAAQVEELAHWYWGALAIGGPQLLSSEQMNEALAAFSTYGQQEPG